ncbi:hypothetical protein C7999DRAFT_16762 [Corynascus novoguineensis]|uniref:C2H2-type domain-containing protein n=1 Tax=Corynascus novoguineensis TaxID=1126955 RepID=A0AAN7CMX1_9PEZI|nr:hypothetical protein C7999DRAFT_16762 [Corynascus novoguineensis]
MANDEKVFQRNYLPQHIRKEIMPIIFGPEAVGTNEQLHKMLRQATMNRDQNAPLYPTIEDVESFEKRCDMQELKQKYIASRDDKGSDHLETKRALSEYLKRRKLLIDLKVQEIREEYFTEADRRRALGQSTSDILTPTAKLYKPQTQTTAVDRLATNIGRFLREKDLGGQRRPQVFSQLLLAYLAKRGTEIETIMDSLEGKKPQDTTQQQPEQFTCLLCLARFPFRGNLTRHNQNVHYKKGAFDRPFPCPQCDRLGKEKYMVEGVEHWSNHVERCHGILYAPCLPSRSCQRWPAEPKPAKKRDARCLICENMFYPGISLSRHFNKEHGSLFKKAFTCHECRREDGTEVLIESRAAWMVHVAEVHARDGQSGVDISERTVPQKRKRAGCEEKVLGTEKHPKLN